MNKKVCETCIKRKTMYCPNSSKCYNTEDKLYYQNNVMLLEKHDKSQNNWNELKDSLEKDIKEYEESEFHIKEPPLTIQTKIDLLLKMEEIESRK